MTNSTTNPNDAGAALTFDDEFTSLSLWNGTSGTWDTTYLFASPTGNGSTLAGNGEQEWYINSNYAPTASVTPWTVNNGTLTLTAAPAAPSIQPLINGYQYTSGEINTSHSFSQTYGYFEMTAELPAGQGYWPAFWLLPESGAWPPEIDAMEVLGNDPTTLYTTVHTDETGTHTQDGLATSVANTSTGFHTYGVDWEPDFITWYFDGQKVFQVATPSDLNQPMYMIANLAVGGSWPGDVNGTTPFPGQIQIEDIRAFASLPSAQYLAAESTPTGPSVATSAATYVAPSGVVDITLTGTAAQTVTANSSGDVITSNDYGSTIIGGTGNDTLIAGHGADVLTGGGGSNIFEFNYLPWNAGQITDFQVGTDKLDLSALLSAAGYTGSDAVADGYVSFVADGGDTQVYFNSHNPSDPWPTLITTLDHVAPTGLTAANVLGETGSNAFAPPVVTVSNVTASSPGEAFAASSLFSVSDPGGNPIAEYVFFDKTSGSGYWALNGVATPADQDLFVPAAQLSQVTFHSATTGSDDVMIAATDAYSSSPWTDFQINAAVVSPPVVTVSNVTASSPGEAFAASSLFSVSDPGGNPIAEYVFFDKTSGSGYWALNGVATPADQDLFVPAAQLSQVTFHSATTGSDDVMIAATDAYSSSPWTDFQINAAVVSPPVVTVSNVTASSPGEAFAASSLFSVSDPGGYPIAEYVFFDKTSGSGYWALNGVATPADQDLFVPAAQLSQVTFHSATTGSDDVMIAATDAYSSSPWTDFHINAAVVSPPVVTVSNMTASSPGEAFAASSLFSVSDPGGNPITEYVFFDKTSGSGYWALNGVATPADQDLFVPAAQLSQVTFHSATTGSDDVMIAATDAYSSSPWTDFHINAAVVSPPVVTVSNMTASSPGEVLPASSLVQIQTSAATYTLPSNVQDVQLTGTAAQTVTGNSLCDVITSNDHGSTIIGGSGNDTLIAGHGADMLTGGGGSDTFVFDYLPWNAGHITDFNVNADVLDLRGLFNAAGYHGTDPVADGYLSFAADSTSEDTKVYFDPQGPSTTIPIQITTLDHVSPASLHATDWIYH